MFISLTFSVILSVFLGTSPNNQLVESARLHITSQDPDFGGLSGLDFVTAGLTAKVISDRGLLYDVTFQRDRVGTLIAVDIGTKADLRPQINDGKWDIEGLAISASEQVYISFENKARVRELNQSALQFLALPTPPRDIILRYNKGYEALAIDEGGHLYTLQELLPRQTQNYPLYRLQKDQWDLVAKIPKSPGFQVTGADFGPNGDFFILERAFSFLGFRSQIRRVQFTGDAVQVDLLWRSPVALYDNLEGLAVWQDPAGKLRFLMVSDDNYKAFQRTEFVEFTTKE